MIYGPIAVAKLLEVGQIFQQLYGGYLIDGHVYKRAVRTGTTYAVLEDDSQVPLTEWEAEALIGDVRVTSPNGAAESAIKIHPLDPNKVIAGTNGPGFLQVMHYSVNGGSTWTQAAPLPPDDPKAALAAAKKAQEEAKKKVDEAKANRGKSDLSKKNDANSTEKADAKTPAKSADKDAKKDAPKEIKKLHQEFSVYLPPLVGEDLEKLLDIPAHVKPVAYLCLGYVEEFASKPDLERAGWLPRMGLSEVVCYEKWGRHEPDEWSGLASSLNNI